LVLPVLRLRKLVLNYSKTPVRGTAVWSLATKPYLVFVAAQARCSAVSEQLLVGEYWSFGCCWGGCVASRGTSPTNLQGGTYETQVN
jgi:hypothetical protein